MTDGMDHGSEIELNDLGAETRENVSPDTRATIREGVRTLRDGSADGCGELIVASTPSPREEARDFSRHANDAQRTMDDGRSRLPGGAEAAFEARCTALTHKQLMAINLISMGKTIAATARTIRVDPGTIHRWKATHPLFAAELGRRQAAMFDATVTKLRLTMERAIDELHAIVTGPSKRDRAEATWRLLPMLRPARLVIPTGPTSATAVIDAQIRAGRKERGEAVEGEITLEERLDAVPAEFLADPRKTL